MELILILPKFARPFLLFSVSSGFLSLHKQILLDKNSQRFYILVCNYFTAKHYQSRCRSGWENPDRSEYRFQSIKFGHFVVRSPCDTEAHNNKMYMLFAGWEPVSSCSRGTSDRGHSFSQDAVNERNGTLRYCFESNFCVEVQFKSVVGMRLAFRAQNVILTVC